jgi:hypothetical protein
MDRVRDGFVDFMRLRGYAERTVEAYAEAAGKAVRLCGGKPPRRIEEHEIRAWLLHLKAQKSARSTFSIGLGGARQLFAGYLERLDGSRVTFRWKDSATGATRRTTLAAADFLTRFLQHVLPRGFKKVRYFGLWAPAHRAKLAVADDILDHRPAATTPTDRATREHDHHLSSVIAWVCRSCGSVSSNPPREIPRDRAPPP